MEAECLHGLKAMAEFGGFEGVDMRVWCRHDLQDRRLYFREILFLEIAANALYDLRADAQIGAFLFKVMGLPPIHVKNLL